MRRTREDILKGNSFEMECLKNKDFAYVENGYACFICPETTQTGRVSAIQFRQKDSSDKAYLSVGVVDPGCNNYTTGWIGYPTKGTIEWITKTLKFIADLKTSGVN